MDTLIPKYDLLQAKFGLAPRHAINTTSAWELFSRMFDEIDSIEIDDLKDGEDGWMFLDFVKYANIRQSWQHFHISTINTMLDFIRYIMRNEAAAKRFFTTYAPLALSVMEMEMEMMPQMDRHTEWEMRHTIEATQEMIFSTQSEDMLALVKRLFDRIDADRTYIAEQDRVQWILTCVARNRDMFVGARTMEIIDRSFANKVSDQLDFRKELLDDWKKNDELERWNKVATTISLQFAFVDHLGMGDAANALRLALHMMETNILIDEDVTCKLILPCGHRFIREAALPPGRRRSVCVQLVRCKRHVYAEGHATLMTLLRMLSRDLDGYEPLKKIDAFQCSAFSLAQRSFLSLTLAYWYWLLW